MRTSRNTIAALLAAVLALALVAAACGDDDDTTTATGAATTSAGGSATSAAGGNATYSPPDSLPKATLNGSGATFPAGFYEVAIANFSDQYGDVTINYAGGGSGKGRTDLQEGIVDFAGSDAPVKDADVPKFKGDFLYFPTVVAPVTVSYNLPEVDKLQLSPATIAKIFQAQITTWNDPAIAADNPDADLPDTPITVAHRSDGSGTTENFTKFLDAAAGASAGGVWTLGSGSTVEWPGNTQGGEGNSGVAEIVASTEGAIGYVDLSDAKATDLSFAAVKNKAGNFVEPTLEATSKAVEGATIKPDLTFFAGWADGADAYPIAAQTWILVYKAQSDPAKAQALKAFLGYVLTDGQDEAESVDYAPLPEALRTQALAQLDLIGAA